MVDLNEQLNYYYQEENGKPRLYSMVDSMVAKYGLNDKTEFYSIANEVFTKVLQNYDTTKETSFSTFLYGCLEKKFITYIDYLNRGKRCKKDEDGNYIQEDSLDRPIGSEDTTTLGEMITGKEDFVDKLIEVEGSHIQEFKNKLSPLQRKIVDLFLEGESHIEVRDSLGLTEAKFNKEFAEIKKYENISVLKRNQVKTKKKNMEGKTMGQLNASNNGDKSKMEVCVVDDLVSLMDDGSLLTDNPLQREADQWTPEYKGNLVTTILNGFKFSPIVVCQEFINNIGYDWLIDGKQRATVIYQFRNNIFKVSQKSLKTKINYLVNKTDENGNFMRDDDGRILKEVVEFDIAGKFYKDLPEELKRLFDRYQVSIEKYLNCTKEEIQYHIVRYNDAKPMSVSNKGILKLGNEWAATVKKVASSTSLFSTAKEFLNIKNLKADVQHRIIIEAIMASYYPDKWAKGYDKICSFLAENVTSADFDEMGNTMEYFSEVITEESGKLLTTSETFLWIATFDKFYNEIMNEEPNGQKMITRHQFNDFMIEFINNLHNKIVNGVTFDDLREKGTKDVSIVAAKLNHLANLMFEYFGVEPLSRVDFVKDEDVVEEENSVVANDISIEETTAPELHEDHTEVLDNEVEKLSSEVVEASDEAYTKPHDASSEVNVEEDTDPLFDYIDAFCSQKIVREAMDGKDKRDVNRVALQTLMVNDKMEDLSDEAIGEYVKNCEVKQEEVDKITGRLEGLAAWSVLVGKDNLLVQLKNIPILTALVGHAQAKGFDFKTVKNWFETFAFTYRNEMDEKGLYEILMGAITDMDKNCTVKKKPMLNF